MDAQTQDLIVRLGAVASLLGAASRMRQNANYPDYVQIDHVNLTMAQSKLYAALADEAKAALAAAKAGDAQSAPAAGPTA